MCSRSRRDRGCGPLTSAARGAFAGGTATVAAAASTAAAPMLSGDRDGDGGAAPRKRLRKGCSEAPGQRRRVAVVRPAGPPPRTPASTHSSTRTAPSGLSAWAAGGGGYAAGRSPTTDDRAEQLSPRSG